MFIDLLSGRIFSLYSLLSLKVVTVEEVIPALFSFSDTKENVNPFYMLSVVMSDSKETLSTTYYSSTMMCIPLLWVMLQLLLPASVEFTLNFGDEDIIFGNYSFCHNQSWHQVI